MISDLRGRLLDLTNKNRLLNFRFSDRTRTHVRIINEIPDVLYGKLVDGKKLTFIPLPDPEEEPEDERSDEFFLALEAARRSDEEYLRALETFGEEDETSAKAQNIERALKDRLRQQLGLPSRPTRDSMAPGEYARANGIDPSYDLPRPSDRSREQPTHLDDEMQTLLFADQLARTALSEMGVNILYAAFGYLEWYESEFKAKVPLLITDTNTSQFSAIADVMDGKHLSIKGPPGTGKSQTITNIIAAAMAKGQKVLFMAEKMAALEVVKKRLNEAGLGEFCLEVHSTKASKKDVLESLRKRLELRPSSEPSALDQAIEEHQRHHEQLTRYVGLLNRPFGNSGKSIQQSLWGAIHAMGRAKALGLPTSLDDVLLPNALDLTAIDLRQRRDALEALEQLSAPIVVAYGAPGNHPWAGMRRMDLSPFEQGSFIRALESWHDSLLTLEETVSQASTDLGLAGLTTIDDIRYLTDAVALLPLESDAIISDILPKLKNAEVLCALEQFTTLVQNAQKLRNSLHVKLEDPVGCLSQADTVRSLDAERHKLEVGAQVFDGRVEELPMLAERHRQFA